MTSQVPALCYYALFFLAISSNGIEQQSSDTFSAGVHPLADSAGNTDIQEHAFQEGVDKLFITNQIGPDSISWDSMHSNGERFDSQNWADTARIVLIDSVNKPIYVHPFRGCVTSSFGERRWLWHYGVDIKLKKGDTVKAAFDGVVRIIQYDRRGYGNVVVIQHQGGLETIYGHLSKKMVVPNQVVKAGDVIGLGGNTGRSTGSHLHFEIRYRGEPFDPNDIVDFDGGALRQDTLILTKKNFEYLVELRKAKWHMVCQGNTLGHIARRYHTTIQKLCELNHITRKTTLRVGRKIRYQ
jgi:murein DD-endopeptidase MepM/ murein hydrolase activator NlpD